MNTTITNALPDIPRLFTAVCEWLACAVYLAIIYRRVASSKTIIVLAAGLPVMIGTQYVAGIMPKSLWILGMLLAFTGMFLIIVNAGGLRKREALYLTARAFVLAELVASLHWQLVTFLGLGGYPSDNPMLSIAVLLTTYAACFGVAWYAERTNFSQTSPTVPSLSTTTATIAITTVTFAMSNLSFLSTNTPFSGTVGQEIFYIRTLVDFCGFAILYAQQEQSRRIAANAELASIDAQLHSQHQEYLQSKDNLESLGRIAHDLKHQIGALRSQVDPQHVAEGFEQLEAAVGEYSAQQHTGNPVLDVILTSKARLCAHQGITFTAVADGKLLAAMSSMDIASLFGNALDNAIEASSKLDDTQHRLIRLALYAKHDFVVIRVENYYASPVSTDAAGDLKTMKADEHKHGFGVKSIQHIAHQYDGAVTIRTHDHWFVLTVLLPH